MLQRLRLEAEENGIVGLMIMLYCISPIPSISPVSVGLLPGISSFLTHTHQPCVLAERLGGVGIEPHWQGRASVLQFNTKAYL